MTLTLLRQKRILRDKKICKNVTNFTCMYSNEKKNNICNKESLFDFYNEEINYSRYVIKSIIKPLGHVLVSYNFFNQRINCDKCECVCIMM